MRLDEAITSRNEALVQLAESLLPHLSKFSYGAGALFFACDKSLVRVQITPNNHCAGGSRKFNVEVTGLHGASSADIGPHQHRKFCKAVEEQFQAHRYLEEEQGLELMLRNLEEVFGEGR